MSVVAQHPRFDRLVGTATFAGDAHARWSEAVVAVIGAGVVGGQFVREAVRSGARCEVFDPGHGEEVNLGTQDVAVGEPKAVTLARRCDAFAPGAVRAEVVDVRHVGPGRFRGVDLLVDCSDDPALALPLTRISNGWGIPLIRIAVDGSGTRELGRVLVSHGGGGSACQLCASSWREVFEAGPRTPCFGDREGTPSTYAGSAVAMVVAGHGLLVAQRLVGGHDRERVIDRETLFDLDAPQLLPMRLERSERCLTGHEVFDPVRLPRPAGETTVRELLAAAEAELLLRNPAGATDLGQSVRAGSVGHPVQPTVVCPSCREVSDHPGTQLRPGPDCRRCGLPMLRRRDVSLTELDLVRAELLGVADLSCATLGFPASGALVAARTAGLPTIHLLFPTERPQ